MAVFLGIDGGGTGCRALAADDEGRILGRGEAGSANISSDLEAATRNILSAAEAALNGAAPAVVVAGLAGANVPDLAQRLAAKLPFARFKVVSDAATGLKGAFGAEDGIAAALGTGSVFASQREGRVRSIGGWGFALGDEASGAWMGRRLLQRCLRAAEGYTAVTPFLASIAAELGGPPGIVRFSLSAQPAAYAVFARRIVDAAEEGDSEADAILAEADTEIAASIALLSAEGPLPVVFLGGLGPLFARRLAGRWDIREALGTALDGALAMAREMAP
jgi:glucosamine kinase